MPSPVEKREGRFSQLSLKVTIEQRRRWRGSTSPSAPLLSRKGLAAVDELFGDAEQALHNSTLAEAGSDPVITPADVLVRREKTNNEKT